VAPFDIALINLKAGDSATDRVCEELYGKLAAAGRDVLYDDTADRPGAKFAAMDLIGIPYQIIVGPRGLEKGVVEVKTRRTGTREELSPDAAVNRFAAS
jgi:prolyl-tRNA synthetase